MQLTREVTIGETSFRDFSHAREGSVRIEQIQQRRIRGPKLTDERIRRGFQEFRDARDPDADRARR